MVSQQASTAFPYDAWVLCPPESRLQHNKAKSLFRSQPRRTPFHACSQFVKTKMTMSWLRHRPLNRERQQAKDIGGSRLPPVRLPRQAEPSKSTKSGKTWKTAETIHCSGREEIRINSFISIDVEEAAIHSFLPLDHHGHGKAPPQPI